ncbi:MAG: hypothetical protein A2666_04070 [Parcubacteria group bacterium RIFCSPHIGHO2_01_FULL_47_10b]|nr:MAG: hypothetical protein A2666_04070 [Parcubacteria group bacterium RIFCSPHIGHO2_01_FULL_47_10b]
MRIKYARKFEKQLQKLPNRIQQKCFARIRIFEDNPYDSRLRTHHLSGTLSGRQAFWIDFRYRVIFIIADEKGQHVAYFSAIGTHAIYD